MSAPAANDPAPAPVTQARPDFIPEKFWDADKSQVRADDFKAYFEKLTGLEQQTEARRALVPESPDKYELGLPEGVTLPEGMALDMNDPRLPALREFAHKAGWSQAEFNQVVALDIQRAQADAAAINAAKAVEIKALGENANMRIDAVSKFITAQAKTPEQAKAVGEMLMSAQAVEFFESLVSKLSSQGVDPLRAGGAASNSFSEEAWAAMTPSQRLAATWKPGLARTN